MVQPSFFPCANTLQSVADLVYYGGFADVGDSNRNERLKEWAHQHSVARLCKTIHLEVSSGFSSVPSRKQKGCN